MQRKGIQSILMALTIVGCATVEPSQTETKSEDPAVKRQTILPGLFRRGIGEGIKTGEALVVPSQLLQVGQIVRPRAELREGPGSQFPLNDQLLTKGARIFVFDELGVWRKVVVAAGQEKGWIHHRTIDVSADGNASVKVPVEKLPTVIVTTQISRAFAYPGKEPMKVQIPRGAIFHTFRKAKDRRLVWIPETNSVLWLPERNVR